MNWPVMFLCPCPCCGCAIRCVADRSTVPGCLARPQEYGWDGALQCLFVCCFVGGLAVLPLWNAMPAVPKVSAKQA